MNVNFKQQNSKSVRGGLLENDEEHEGLNQTVDIVNEILLYDQIK